MPHTTWQLAHGKSLDLTEPKVVAILNITPDSFADGGQYNTPAKAIERARQCAEEGAQVLEVGGESTRPGADRISAEEQLARILPVIEGIRRELPEILISVDTTRSAVAKRAIEAGAHIINDVSAGQEDEAILTLGAKTGAGLVLMHRLRPPGEDSFSDQYASAPEYTDVVGIVRTYLEDRVQAAVARGVREDAVVIDPGLGFGKSVEQNLELIRRTAELCSIGRAVMSAASRKSFIGRVGLGRGVFPDLNSDWDARRAGCRLMLTQEASGSGLVMAFGHWRMDDPNTDRDTDGRDIRHRGVGRSGLG